MPLFTGQCHCGNLRIEMEWPAGGGKIPARACGCDFCTRHGAAWTSHPAASLRIEIDDSGFARRYRFGTGTADFHLCGVCGVPVAATSDIGGRLYAVANVNVLGNIDTSQLDRSSSNFDGETTETRLARRRERWIGEVQITVSHKKTE